MGANEFTYRVAGVDIDASEEAVDLIKKHARTTFNHQVLSDVGFFSGLYQLGKYRSPVLVSSTDGVGTKVRVASLLGRYDTIGIDLVNHCVNDILVGGATPLFFLDYIATGRLVPTQIGELVKGLASACKDVGCALIGGETAEMPGIYRGGDFDLAGFIVGVVEKDELIDGSSIAAGDVLLGLPSSGLHTNGYSLVRKVFGIEDDRSALDTLCPELGRSLGDELLEPHRCYYAFLKGVLAYIKGMAHITGGGLPGNLPRILPDGLAAALDPSSWDVPTIFELIRQMGDVPLDEMYQVFNMGLGMIVVCSPEDVDKITVEVQEAVVVGEVLPQKDHRRVILR